MPICGGGVPACAGAHAKASASNASAPAELLRFLPALPKADRRLRLDRLARAGSLTQFCIMGVKTDAEQGGCMPAKVNKTDEEWRAELTPEQYEVLRGKG